MIAPVRPITIEDVEAAGERIAGTVLRTPLVRLDLGPNGPDIRLKLENLQPTNAYKIRGAANAVARLSQEERARGVWTISAGNAGQAVAYAARTAGIPCAVVAIANARNHICEANAPMNPAKTDGRQARNIAISRSRSKIPR